MSKRCYATTMDNPWNPFTQRQQWTAFDTEKSGYNTDCWLAIFSKHCRNLEEDENNDAIEEAVDKVLDINPSGIHYKLYEDEADVMIPLANETFKAMQSSLIKQPPK